MAVEGRGLAKWSGDSVGFVFKPLILSQKRSRDSPHYEGSGEELDRGPHRDIISHLPILRNLVLLRERLRRPPGVCCSHAAFYS